LPTGRNDDDPGTDVYGCVYFFTVRRSIPRARATALVDSPPAIRSRICCTMPGKSRGRPTCLPSAFALTIPAFTRSDSLRDSCLARVESRASRRSRTSSLSVERCASVYEWALCRQMPNVSMLYVTKHIVRNPIRRIQRLDAQRLNAYAGALKHSAV